MDGGYGAHGAPVRGVVVWGTRYDHGYVTTPHQLVEVDFVQDPTTNNDHVNSMNVPFQVNL